MTGLNQYEMEDQNLLLSGYHPNWYRVVVSKPSGTNYFFRVSIGSMCIKIKIVKIN